VSSDATTPPPAVLDRAGYDLENSDEFDGTELDRSLWLPHYLPQWSSREASAARYALDDGVLRLRIDDDQPPWCPECNGWLRVSSLQTGVFAGALGSEVGQHRFAAGLRVREEQPAARLYTPQYGLFELRARAIADPANMVALWMIGFEDEPERSAEICIFEVFGSDVATDTAVVGMGVRPFGDPAIVDEFSRETIPMDAREFHVYAAEWTPQHVAFYVDERLVKVVGQSPAYPMQFMLNVYEFADGPGPASPIDRYPKVFEVDWFRGYRRVV
jgi:hypothetical protein